MSICSNRNPDNSHYSKRIGLREYCCGELNLDYFKGPNVQKNFSDSEYFRYADNNEIPQCKGWWSSHATELDLITLKEIHQLQKTYVIPEVIQQSSGSILTCSPDLAPKILTYFDGNKRLEKIICSEESKSLMIDHLPGCNNNICFVEKDSPNYSLIKNPPVNPISTPIISPNRFSLFGATGTTGSTGSTGSSSNTALIIGIIVGVVVLLILIGVGLYFLLRKKKPVIETTTVSKTTTTPIQPAPNITGGPVESNSVFTTRIVNTPGYQNYQPITYSGIDNGGGLTVYKTETIPTIL